MVAAGQDVDSQAEEFLGDLGRDAETARGVFAVGYAEIDLVLLEDVFQVVGDNGAAYVGEDVADKKNVH